MALTWAGSNLCHSRGDMPATFIHEAQLQEQQASCHGWLAVDDCQGLRQRQDQLLPGEMLYVPVTCARGWSDLRACTAYKQSSVLARSDWEMEGWATCAQGIQPHR